MPAQDALRALRREPGPAPVGMTWVPALVLEAMFHGRASSPAEALGAFAAEVPLDLAFVPAEKDWAADAVGGVREAGALAAWALSGPLGRVEEKRGWTEALRLTASAPAEIAFALDEALHEALDDVRRGAALDVGAIVVADDLAGATGPLLSPDYALEVLVPLYKRIAAEAATSGLPAIFHSDGDTRSLVPSLARAGFCAVHPGGLFDEALEAYRATAAENGMALLGGLNGRRMLASARDSAAAAAQFAASGGVVITDDGSIASPEQLAAFVSAARALRGAGHGARA